MTEDLVTTTTTELFEKLPPQVQAELHRRFTYHKPVGDQPERYTALRAQARHFAALVCLLVPQGREQSLALTKIEEAIMWSNAGIARNPAAEKES